MPLLALNCSLTTRIQPRCGRRKSQPDHKPGQRSGEHDAAQDLAASEAQRSRQFDEARIDAPDGGVGVDVDRKGHPECDQDVFGRFADSEPDDVEGDQRQDRQGARHLHRPIDHVLAQADQPGDEGQSESDQRADGEADGHPVHGDEQISLQLAVGDEMPSRRDDRPGPGQLLFVDPPGCRNPRPQPDEDQRAEQTARPEQATGSRSTAPAANPTTIPPPAAAAAEPDRRLAARMR